MFYTYILIDPRNDQPFYVGKGKGNRAKAHLYDKYTQSYNPLKTNKINSIKRKGYDVKIQKLLCESEQTALNLEKDLIKQYGRIDNGTGILCNLTDGGEGVSGWKHPRHVREKFKYRKRGKKTKEGLKRISEANSKPKSGQTKEKLRANSPKAKPVDQYTKGGEFIATHRSGREAGNQTGIDTAQINSCCTGREKSAGGFIWKYH